LSAQINTPICMIHGKKVIVVLPAYNAAKTLEKTYNEIDFNVVDDVILVDDNSKDDTVEVAKRIGINHILRHDRNYGYGGNQKTCYNYALKIGDGLFDRQRCFPGCTGLKNFGRQGNDQRNACL